MNFLKKQSIGAYITLCALILSIVSIILYNSTLAAGNGVQTANGGQMYLDASKFGEVTTYGVLAIVFLALGLVVSELKLFLNKGIVGMVVEMVGTIFRILAPVFCLLFVVWFLSGSFTGLGWTFFSNEELEINPEAIAAGKLNIVALIFGLVTSLVAIVAAFFRILRKEASVAEGEEVAQAQ